MDNPTTTLHSWMIFPVKCADFGAFPPPEGTSQCLVAGVPRSIEAPHPGDGWCLCSNGWRVQTRGPRPVPTQITGLNTHSLNLSTLKTWSIWSWIYSISPLSWCEYKERSGFPNCNAAPQDPSSPLWWARARPAGPAVPPGYGVDLEANRTTPAVNTSSIFLGIYIYIYIYIYTHTYIYIYIDVEISISICTFMYISTRTYMTSCIRRIKLSSCWARQKTQVHKLNISFVNKAMFLSSKKERGASEQLANQDMRVPV